MRFHIVMAKTVGDLLGFRRTVALLIIGLAPGALIHPALFRQSFQSGAWSLEMQTSFLVGYFLVVVFLWMAGFYLAYLVIGTSGLGMVDREREKGTLLLMVSKPISRDQFLLGKFLALVLTSLLLMAIVLLGSVVIFWARLGLDPDSVTAHLQLLPWVFLFSLVVTLVFASLSLALSAFLGSVVGGAVLMVILVATFAFGPTMRMVWPDTYERYSLYYVDEGYHLGNAYVLLLDRAETGKMSPDWQAWLGFATGAYRAGIMDVFLYTLMEGAAFDPDIGAMPPSLERTTYVAPAISIGLSLAVAATALGAASLALNRRDVH